MSIWRHPVQVSRQLTDWVASKNPHVVTQKDFRGRYPIHYAISSSDTERFQALLQSHHSGLVDGEGNHLLHLAVADSHRVASNILAILKERPEALSAVNSRGELPVHVSIKQADRNLLLQHFPFAMLYTTNDGRTVWGNARRELERCIRTYYPLEEDDDDDDAETSGGWERPSVSWIFPTDPSSLGVLDHLFYILSTQVVPPPLREVVAQSCLAITRLSLPLEVANEILLFAVPHYMEALYHSSYMNEPR
jgi:hypothetical protein